MWPFKKKATAEQVSQLLHHVSVLAERIDDLSEASRARSDHAADQLVISTKTITQHCGQLQQATSTQGVAIASINDNLARIVTHMRDITELEKQVDALEEAKDNLEADLGLAGSHAANLERDRDDLQRQVIHLNSCLDNYDEQLKALNREKAELAEQLGNSESDAQANLQIMHSLREACNHYKEAVTELMRERDELKSQLQQTIISATSQAGQVVPTPAPVPAPVELSATAQSFLQRLATDLQTALQSNSVGANLQQPNPPAPISGLDSASVYNIASSNENAAAKQREDSPQIAAFRTAEVESALRTLANPVQFAPTAPEIVGTAAEGAGQVEIGTSAGFAPVASRPVLLPSQQQYLYEAGSNLQP